MMEYIKNLLFDVFVIIGLISMIVMVLWWILKTIDRIFKFSKCIIMYKEFQKNQDLYHLRNKVVVAKNGKISYSCVGDIDRQIEILNKGIEYAMTIKNLGEGV